MSHAYNTSNTLQLTFADFEMACMMDLLNNGKYHGIRVGIGATLPKALHDHCARVEALPGVKEWIAKRPHTDI
jgi:hypothetical protein